MKLNVGGLESFVRIFIGAVLVYCSLTGYIGKWGYLGAALLITGLARFCPITCALGINTNRSEDENHS